MSTSSLSSGKLFQQHDHQHNTRLTERSRSALTALLILIIENHHAKSKSPKRTTFNETPLELSSSQAKSKEMAPSQLSQELMSYLLTILENLPHFRWIDEQFVTSTGTTRASKFNWMTIIYSTQTYAPNKTQRFKFGFGFWIFWVFEFWVWVWAFCKFRIR